MDQQADELAGSIILQCAEPTRLSSRAALPLEPPSLSSLSSLGGLQTLVSPLSPFQQKALKGRGLELKPVFEQALSVFYCAYLSLALVGLNNAANERAR